MSAAAVEWGSLKRWRMKSKGKGVSEREKEQGRFGIESNLVADRKI